MAEHSVHSMISNAEDLLALGEMEMVRAGAVAVLNRYKDLVYRRMRGITQLNLLTFGPMCIGMAIFESALCSAQFFNLRGKTNDQ